MFMFQSNKQKKKTKLWLACETLFQQYNQSNDVMPSVQPQRHLPQHLHRLQEEQWRFQRTPQQQTSMMDQRNSLYVPMKCSGRCCCSMNSNRENSQPQQQKLLLDQVNTLQCACSNRCFDGVADDMSYPMEMESGSEEMSIEQDYETKIGGSFYESYGDNSIDCNEGDEYDHRYSSYLAVQTEEQMIAQGLLSWPQLQSMQQQTSTTNNNYNNSKNRSTATAVGNVLQNCCCTGGDSVSSTELSVGKCHIQMNRNLNYSLNNNNHNYNNNNAVTIPTHSTVTSTITATAASVLNCCRGNSQSNESSIGSNIYPQNNRNHTLNNNHSYATGINNNNIGKNNFNFYDQKQISTNDSAVKELFEAFIKKLKTPQMDTLLQVVENRCGTDAKHRPRQSSSDCVLVARETIGGEEPNVIACRLWTWPDLKTSTELKRIPMCPNGREKVYVCCNPAHWNRILKEEAVPPPYQESVMDRLKPEDRSPNENSKDGDFSTLSGTTTGLRVQVPESLTTNGENQLSSSPTWCQIDYWELTQRVGERYEAKNSTVNIYSEGSDGMDLKVLAERKGVNDSSVQKTRQKIGLGITLSQEADGVWLYNRSDAPIFIHSTTLNNDCLHVCKVPPGYCLNAFDKNRARTQKLVHSPQTGPIDTFSMKISFAKGWGTKYRRSDITACHCWLDVLFSRR